MQVSAIPGNSSGRGREARRREEAERPGPIRPPRAFLPQRTASVDYLGVEMKPSNVFSYTVSSASSALYV
jgi:hypothetical protein